MESMPLEFPQSMLVDPILARMLEHFENTELVFISEQPGQEMASVGAMTMGSLKKVLKNSRLAFVRIVGVNEADQVSIRPLACYSERQIKNSCASLRLWLSNVAGALERMVAEATRILQRAPRSITGSRCRKRSG